jgi:hypothetical protein
MEKMSKPFAYLACPYSHQDSWRRIARFRAANKAVAELLLAGVNVYSPISHSHPLTEEASLPCSWDFWRKIDRDYIEHSHKMYVLRLPGWEESIGRSG